MTRPAGTTVLLVRHGQPERRSHDGALTPLGSEQAVATGRAIGLRRGDALVSSTRRRAVQTATAFGRVPVQVAGLDEFRSVQNGPDDDNRVGLGPPDFLHRGGAEEDLPQFQDRVQAALGTLLDVPPSARLIVVVHSGVIDAVLRWARGTSSTDPWTSDGVAGHASITELELHPPGLSQPRPRVIRVGDVSHLQEHLRTD